MYYDLYQNSEGREQIRKTDDHSECFGQRCQRNEVYDGKPITCAVVWRFFGGTAYRVATLTADDAMQFECNPSAMDQFQVGNKLYLILP